MTDRFYRKQQELLSAGEENGGLTIKSLFDLQVAAHEEAVEAARLIAEELRATRQEDHVALERITSSVARDCADVAERMGTIERQYLALDCVQHPRAPRRSYDEPGTDYRRSARTLDTSDMDFQTRFMWLVGGKLGYIAIAVLVTAINILLNYLWLGKP